MLDLRMPSTSTLRRPRFLAAVGGVEASIQSSGQSLVLAVRASKILSSVSAGVVQVHHCSIHPSSLSELPLPTGSRDEQTR